MGKIAARETWYFSLKHGSMEAFKKWVYGGTFIECARNTMSYKVL
jgi:hypothetical protein